MARFPGILRFLRMDTLTLNLPAPQRAVVDRRRSKRSAATSELEYRISTKESPLTGTGCLIDISKTGVLLESDRPLTLHSEIRLVAPWPSRPADSAGLELRIHGYIVRTDNNRTAVNIKDYAFGIRG